ncbi:MAG: hypothetical protein ABW157_11445 [Candidatus Thiodiazotropha sp. LLP2]
MNIKESICCIVAMSAILITTSASAESSHSKIAFNNGIGVKTANQPANGAKVAYQVKLQGGELDGCTVDITEALYGRDGGSWGIFDISGDVNCTRGAFTYTSSGAWDSNGFHAAGDIKEGSGSGDFKGLTGRVAQLGGAAVAATSGNGTLDISYQLAVDMLND